MVHKCQVQQTIHGRDGENSPLSSSSQKFLRTYYFLSITLLLIFKTSLFLLFFTLSFWLASSFSASFFFEIILNKCFTPDLKPGQKYSTYKKKDCLWHKRIYTITHGPTFMKPFGLYHWPRLHAWLRLRCYGLRLPGLCYQEATQQESDREIKGSM